jgi:hypothetical protein
MFDRLSNSFALARSSWGVLRTDKQLILLPILSGIGCLFVLLTFALPMIALRPWNQFEDAQGDLQTPWWVYPIAFAYYFCNYFVVIYCNSALISCAMMRFNGEEPTLAKGFAAATSRLPQILAWALVSATVGLLLKAIENVHEKAGAFIAGLLGTGWTIMTYFVVPVLVMEKVGPFEAIARSLAILKKTWGEALIGHFGIGLFLFLLFLPAALLIVLTVAAFASAGIVVGIAALAVTVAYVLLWMAAGSALNTIYLSALYHYAACDEVPTGFEASALAGAFTAKR